MLVGLGLWKCRGMGLLPTGTADWLAFEARGDVSIVTVALACGFSSDAILSVARSFSCITRRRRKNNLLLLILVWLINHYDLAKNAGPFLVVTTRLRLYMAYKSLVLVLGQNESSFSTFGKILSCVACTGTGQTAPAFYSGLMFSFKTNKMFHQH